MSFSETIFLFFLALVIFGPKKLPEIARQVGKVLNEFRRASNEFKSQIEQEIAHLEVEEKKKTILAPSQAPEGTASRTLSLGTTESASVEATASEASTSPATLAATENNVSPSSTESSSTESSSTETPSAETPGATAVPAEQATEALTPEAVTSAVSQESHA
ncbi:MAG TPA: twin-arginine translocase TatA/TatE family subunit [Candidatus Solibacter sp.]|nr:twin-arginine translocase TatA/TatE family subunit [Candidatus Solibacter sp.]